MSTTETPMHENYLTNEVELRHSYAHFLKEITRSLTSEWRIFDRPTNVLSWRYFLFEAELLPAQGWKIHVSVAPIETRKLFDIIIPFFINHRVSFKLPTELEGIASINSGEGGEAQIGKIVTVYPHSTQQAVQVAVELDQVCPNSQGPAVRTDVTLRKGGAVSLRYGPFTGGQVIGDPIGRLAPALRLPDGSLTKDLRVLGGVPLDWAPKLPFDYYTWESHLEKEVVINGKRYLPIALLSKTPISKVMLGLEINRVKTVVMKIVEPGVGTDLRGFDARDRILNEHSILTELHKLPEVGLAPEPLGISDGSPVVLIEEDIDGISLDKVSRAEQINYLSLFAIQISKLHAAGFAHRDIKLSNALLAKSGVRLIDFGLAARIGSEKVPLGATGGYVPPEGLSGSVSTARDVYALGVSVAHILLGCDPASFPRDNNNGRLIGLLNHTGNFTGARVVRNLIQSDPTKRPSASEAASVVRTRLESLVRENESPIRKDTSPDIHWVLRAAWESGLATRKFLQEADSGHWWRNAHFLADFECEGINLGASGIILGLSTIDQVLGTTIFNKDIDGAANWLASREPSAVSHGLFTGNAGVALALTVVAKRLEREDLFDCIRTRMMASASCENEYDLFCGAAGVMLGSCFIADILQEDWPIEIVRKHAAMLLDSAVLNDGVVVWPCSEKLDSTKDHYIGAAHGSAGIAMALAICGRHVGSQHLLKRSGEVLQSIYTNGRTSDNKTMRMRVPGNNEPAPVGSWCHGVMGYLWCLVQAISETSPLEEELDWATNTVSAATANVTDNPTYCHGVAGQLETWRMLTSIARYRKLSETHANRLATTLRLLQQRIGGRSVWCSDDPRIITPDLWIGFLAPATALALYAVGYGPALLSSRWLRTCAGRES